MSIAEQKALEEYPMDEYEFDKAKKSDIERKRFAYIKGYDQAFEDFLEKACKWLSKQHMSRPIFWTIEDFKNYMKNEM